MKKILTLIIAFISVYTYSQGEAISTDLPKLSPPSPTVAAFMKFEEIPVDNYTGVPNIAIPLYSIGTRSKDISLSLSLNYHPASAAPNEVASNVGLGWSFFGGGTISRTVRGYPDEMNLENKWGMYSPSNKYEQFLAVANSSNPTFADSELEYMYNAGIKNKYDTEYDLYQYNFMGHSGRFYINKNYQVVKLDNGTELITYNSTANTFTIYDDKGYKFVFDIKELTTESGLTESVYIEGSSTSASDQITYVSAYQLSNVIDPNNKTLITYYYNTAAEPENIHNVTVTDIRMLGTDVNSILALINDSSCQNKDEMIRKIGTTKITAGKDLAINTKKLTGIRVWGKAKIEIIKETGRIDYNLANGANSSKIKQIVISQYNDQPIGDPDDVLFKKYTLKYAYSEVVGHGKRLLLTEVVEGNFADSETLTHKLYYNDYNLGLYTYDDIGKDYWGYYNDTPLANRTNKETSKTFCSIEMLQKMVLPSGGSIIYDFEPNTYSYVGATALDDYSGNPIISEFNPNPDNWSAISTTTYNFTGYAPANQYITQSPSYRLATFTPFNPNRNLTLFKLQAGTGTPASIDCDLGNPGCVIEKTLAPNTSYNIQYGWLNNDFPANASILVTLKTRSNPTKKWLYGGGVRIKRIGYFTGNISQYHYQVTDTDIPAKEVNYDYQFFDDAMRSSGALAFAKPVYDYTQTKKHSAYCQLYGQLELTQDAYQYQYHTSFNNLSTLRTHGADVGYKNVTVYETGLGKKRYTYVTSIDFPEEEDSYSLTYPFLPSTNFDYKRGSMTKQETFDQAGKKLVETAYTYAPDQQVENIVATGIRFYAPNSVNCPKAYELSDYQAYKSASLSCGPSTYGPLCGYLCGNVTSFVRYKVQEEAFGWVKLTSETTTEYFYNGSTLSGTMATKKDLTYNTTNKQIASVTTETYNGGGSAVETLKNEFEYFVQPSGTGVPNCISMISLNKSYENGLLINTKRVTHIIHNGMQNWLPFTISIGKENQALEVLVGNRYNEFSNPVSFSSPGYGISYVWGYNNSLIIAGIEYVGVYSNLPQDLVTAAQNASNGNDESALITALNNLRNALPNALVTTYTHLPLIGVHTITDPKGDITTYEYDYFGRLKFVKDHFGKKVVENEYHYKP